MTDRLKVFAWIILAFAILQGCYKAPFKEPPRKAELNNIILQAHKAFERGDLRGAQNLYQEALVKSRLIQDDNLTVLILISLSRLYTSWEQIDEAKRCIDSALELSKRINLPEKTLEELYFERSRIGFLLNEDVEEILNDLINSKNTLIKIKALNLLGRIKIKKNEPKVAEKLLNEALKINEQISKLEKANSLRLLGEVYMEKDTEIAEKYLLIALQIDKELALPEKIALDMEKLAYLYKKSGKIDKARDFFLRTLEIWKGLGKRDFEMKIKKELENLPN